MTTATPTTGFRHEALMYASVAELVTTSAAFLRAGVEADDAMLVAVSPDKIDLLRAELGPDADSVDFVDMVRVGRNPATIIPVWLDFVDAHAGRDHGLRGIGEPVWPERSESELVECHHHESLLNVAFGAELPFHLLCPYDMSRLAPGVLETARRTHPVVDTGTGASPSEDFDPSVQGIAPLADPMPAPPDTASTFSFDDRRLRGCRAFVERHAARARLGVERSAEFAVAVNEIATNSVVHGGGSGTLRTWQDGRDLICEVADNGMITDPLEGRRRPRPDATHGRGLWLANHLCDLVQVRSGPAGVRVRLQVNLG